MWRRPAFSARSKAELDVALSEFILLELYVLLRNPTVLSKPASAADAVKICERFRFHPQWQLIGMPEGSRAFHDQLWPRMREESFARLRTYDWRTALSLLQAGVTEFATENLEDFSGFGFTRVWNPLAENAEVISA